MTVIKEGRHYSVDLTTGLDYWTGLPNSWKLPLEEKRADVHRAKTPGHKTCSSVVVIYLNVALSSVSSHPAFFGFWMGTWTWLHLNIVLHCADFCIGINFVKTFHLCTRFLYKHSLRCFSSLHSAIRYFELICQDIVTSLIFVDPLHRFLSTLALSSLELRFFIPDFVL